MIEKGVCETWTPGQEELWERRLRLRLTFAERHLAISIRDLLKYDLRSKQAKIAIAQGRLRIAIATDKELEEIATLEARMQGERQGEIPGLGIAVLVIERLKLLKNTRAKIRERGIKRSELECQ